MSAAGIRLSNQEETEFYAWSFPGAPVQVHLSLDVVREIRQCLAQSSASGASASVTGLLLGTVVTAGFPKITGFRLLHTGKSADLEQAIASVRNSGDSLMTVGYFRTHAGERLALSPEDISLAEAHFSEPNCVLLLIDTSNPAAANAGFFFWERGRLNGGFYDFCFLEFPFDVAMLTTGHGNPNKDPEPHPDLFPGEPFSLPLAEKTAESIPELKPAQPPPPIAYVAPQPPAKPLPEIDATPVAAARNNQMLGDAATSTPKAHFDWRIPGLLLLTLTCFAAGIFLTQKLAQINKNTEPAPIALKVEQQGTDLSVRWNQNSPVISNAESGRLTIYDGGAREFALDKNHIRCGSIVYSPVSDHILIQLDIQTREHRTVRESVQVILNRLNQSELTESSAVVQPPQPAAGSSQHMSPLTSSVAGDPASGEPSTAVPASTKPQATRSQATREFSPPGSAAAAAAHSETSSLAPPPPVASHSAPSPILPPPSPLPLPPAQTPPPKAAANDGLTPSQPPVRLADRLTPVLSEYVPPVAIRQIPPAPLTPAQRAFVSRSVVVEVTVFIDASGKVTKTEPFTHANPVLITAARSAATLWTFQPARRNGQNVASEMILRFKFDPAR
jgi:hypothetical protein